MNNLITYHSSMYIVDDEVLRDETQRVSNRGNLLLTPEQPSRRLFFIGRCGGEVRIELTVVITQATGGGVSVRQSAKLYEGTSTSSRDLDGSSDHTGTVGANNTQRLSFRVRNTEERGDDYADLTLTITNRAVSADDCAANIGAKARELGTSFTGAPTSDLSRPTAVRDGHRVTFERCDIYCSQATGTHEVHGDIRAKYNSVGGPDNALRLPRTDETTTPDSRGRFNHFSGNGSIYWHPNTGPKIVRGAIRNTWAARGWERGIFGYPTSDEITVRPNEWFSDFQNGVIYWDGDRELDPATAGLSGHQVRQAFEAIFRRATGSQEDLIIDRVAIGTVSDTGYDFVRSLNRTITFKISGEYAVDWLPDPNYTISLRIAFETNVPPNGTRACTLSARLAHWHIHTSGIGHDRLLRGLQQGILQGFQAPMVLGEVPAEAGLLSFKVMRDGGLKLYFKGGPTGRVVAIVAQQKLDELL